MDIFPELEYQLNSPVLVHNAHDVLVRETINRRDSRDDNVSQMMSRLRTQMPFWGRGREGGGRTLEHENIWNVCVSVRYILQVLIKPIKIDLVPKYFLCFARAHITDKLKRPNELEKPAFQGRFLIFHP